MRLFRPYQPKAGSAPAAPTAEPPRQSGRAAKRSDAPARDAQPQTAQTAAPPAAQATAPRPAQTAAAQTAAPAPAAPSADAKPAADRAGGASDRITVKAPVKKATPTPTRRQALAARQERINPVLDKKEQRRRDRAARNQQREDSFLKVHAKPVNTMIRDYVDSRWSLAEFVLPLLLLILLSTMLGGRNPFFMLAGMAISYGAMLLVAIDMVLMWRGCRRALRQHFPNEPLKGKFGYAASRAMSMRRTRLPRAEVKRGNKFTWPRPLS